MTLKQTRILEAASQLFANEGFHATSTSKVAKRAGVSEGLIFRHFNNKDGLVDAVIHKVEEHILQLYMPIFREKDSKEILKKVIELPFTATVDDLENWKLQFKFSWETDQSLINKGHPLKEKLTEAFTQLRYKKPELETDLLIHYLGGILGSILKGTSINNSEYKIFMMNKYHIELS